MEDRYVRKIEMYGDRYGRIFRWICKEDIDRSILKKPRDCLCDRYGNRKININTSTMDL